MHAIVSIALPTYNRPDSLAEAIRCFEAQTYPEWELTIFDNCSPNPQVAEVAQAACRRDQRIQYVRRPENVGASENFRLAAIEVNRPFFMWASDDDFWEPSFIATLMKLLQDRPDCAAAGCNIDNVNRSGRVFRRYPPISRLKIDGATHERIRAFIADPEILGKANLFYCIFRTEALQDAIRQIWADSCRQPHGADVVFLLGFLARHRIVTTDDVLLHKRIFTDKTSYRLRRDPRTYFVPLRQYRGYRNRMLSVVGDEAQRELVRSALRERLIGKYLYRLPGLARKGDQRLV